MVITFNQWKRILVCIDFCFIC